MSNNWFKFLEQKGATFNSEREVTFKNTHSSNDLFITDLSWLGTIAVTGDDSKTFLQGQLTNDINHITPSHYQLSGLCTPKGRLKALFSIFSNNENNTLYLQLPYPLLEETLKRLKIFVMMSQVELTDVSDDRIKIGIYGDKAEHYLTEYGFTIPDHSASVSHYNGMQLIRLQDNNTRFECMGNNDSIQKLWTHLQNDAQYCNTAQWKLLDIAAGLPNVYSHSKEVFIPQMLNLHVLDGVNFKKGCYTGQEVVARMQYLGKLKRRMYRIQSASKTLPLAGDNLYSEFTKSGQGAGNIVDAHYSASGDIDCLAVINNEAVEKNDVFLDEALQHKATLVELPYSVDTKE